MNPNHLLAAAAGLALTTTALAGGGPDNVLLLIDPSDPDSLHIGNAYADARGLPEGSVLYMRPWAGNHQDFVDQNLEALFGELEQRGIGDRIDYILIAPTDQYRLRASSTISDGCFPVSNFSVSACYTMAFVADEVLGGLTSQHPNRFFRPSGDPVGFDSEVAWLGGLPSTGSLARRYFIGATLGYTRDAGNTVEEVLDMIDRSAAADGSRPAGRFFFMNNASDPARNVRQPSYALVISDMTAAGADALQVDGRLPASPPTALGIMTGFSSADIVGAAFTFADGAFADHLTSFAGALAGTGQSELSEWIRKGASGSAGAVEEPCNYPGKFPHPRLHHFYWHGASLGESYLRSAQYLPFQIMLYGDPICSPLRPHPTRPDPRPAHGRCHRRGHHPPPGEHQPPNAAAIDRIDVYINGALHASAASGAPVRIDTTRLPEGPTEIVAVAADTTPVATTGRFVGQLLVDNTPAAASLTPDVSTLSLGQQARLSLSAPGASEIRVVHNGRVVGALSSASGDIRLFGRSLGAGPVRLRALAEYPDGSLARSAPIMLTVTDDGATTGAAPAAFSYTRTARPDAPFVLELPATFDDSMRDATWTITQPPAQADILFHGARPAAILRPHTGASGTDELRFRVTTSGGASNTATITIVYQPLCRADLTGDGILDFFDFLEFQDLFVAGDPRADFDDNGILDFFDFLAFQNAFTAGCE
jgi:hypothetical protein